MSAPRREFAFGLGSLAIVLGVLELTVSGHSPLRGLGFLCIGISQLASAIDWNPFPQMTAGEIYRGRLAVRRGERAGPRWNLAISVLGLLGVALVAYSWFHTIVSVSSGWFR